MLLALVVLLSTTFAQDLKVAAAADLSAALEKLSAAFEKQTGIHLSISLGSSGNFYSQIQNGAPFDVFLSADKSYPDKLMRAGLTDGGQTLYARGQLVVWISNSSQLQLESKNLQVLAGNLDQLAGPVVRKIAIANPEHAPYGRAAVEALKHYGIYDRVQKKLVLGENISQTAQFGQSGNADVAFIALSLAMTDSMRQSGHYLILPSSSYSPLEQAGVVVRASASKEKARRFLDFLVSPEGQRILRQSGFESPQK